MHDIPFPKKQLTEQITQAIGQLKAKQEEPHINTSKKQETPEDDGSYIDAPRSIEIMADLLHQEIIRLSNNAGYDELDYQIAQIVKDGSYMIIFSHSSGCSKPAKEEPCFHDDVSSILSTLSAYSSNNVQINTDELFIHFQDRMSLFRLISDYIEDPDNKISHVDEVVLSINHDKVFDDPQHEEQVRPQIVDHILRKTAKITENIYQNETMADQFLYTTSARAYGSLQDYYAASGLQRYVDNNHSLSHILKTIMFEEGEDVSTPPNGWDLTLSTGGYH